MGGAAFAAWLAGLGLGASLIIAIGAQNAFVLRQGIRREHVFTVVAICIACDVALITAGAIGFGSLIRRFPLVTAIAAWAGAAFLLVYGALAFRSALKSESLHAAEAGARDASLQAAVATTLAVSLLNPHVYLDTVVLIGGIGAQYTGAMRVWFAVGAACASTAWFSALGFGARALAPVFDRPVAWRVLDALVGIVMWTIAIGLVVGQLR